MPVMISAEPTGARSSVHLVFDWTKTGINGLSIDLTAAPFGCLSEATTSCNPTC